MPQSDFWDKLKQRLKEVSTAAADFTEEQALVGKLKFEILGLKRKIDRHNRELGERVRDLARREPPPQPFDDKEVQRYLSEIIELEDQVQQKREEIGKVADQVRRKGGAATAEVVEPSGGEPEEAAEPKPKPKRKPRAATAPKSTTAGKGTRTRRKSQAGSKDKTK